MPCKTRYNCDYKKRGDSDEKQLISILTVLALTLNVASGGVIASELPVVGNSSVVEITADEQFSAPDSTSDPAVTLDSTSHPSVADVASLTLQQQLERRQQRAAASEGEISAFALGDETEPFYISNAAQLAELATLVNAGNASFISAHYMLLNDIDLSAYAVDATVDGVEYTTGWTPIGTYANRFAGTFDGQDHKITNLTIDNSTADYQGLFGYAAGTFKNLGVVDVSVKGGSRVGGVVGWAAFGSTITNCHATGSVTGNDNENVGGVAGYANAAVSNCYATGSVSGNNNVGGVVGQAFSVSNCYATGSVSGTGAVGFVGGVVGYANNTASNCYATGSVSGTGNFVGGVVGGADGGTVSNCIALNPSVSGNSDVGAVASSGTVSSSYYWGSMSVKAGSSPVTDATDGTTALTYSDGLKHGDTSLAWTGFTDENGWNLGTATTLPTLQNVGGTQSSTRPAWITSGVAAESIVYIRTAAELAQLATDVNNGTKTYVNTIVQLMNDIDLSAYAIGATVDGVQYTTGWIPIGTELNQFAGTFDGQNHKITNLTIDSTAVYQGLFGYVTDAGKIQNLGVENVSVKGDSSVGGVVGYTQGAVSNCYATGSVSGTGKVGGVVGWAGGSVSNCYATGSVSGNGSVGGVVGAANTVSNCYATGSVRGTGVDGRVGGVVGYAGKSVSNCVALNPSVSGNSKVGAVVGALRQEGTVSSSYYWGGMSVMADGSAVATPTDGTTALTCDGTSGLNGANLAWTGFTDENGWNLGTATSLPTLQNVGGTQSSTLPVSITKNMDVQNYVFIHTAADLKKLADSVNSGTTYENKIVLLLNDIDLSGYAEGIGWTPIGTITQDVNTGMTSTKAFSGTFDGQEHKITNLTIDNSTAEYQGLFGYVSATGKIQNLGVVDVSVKGANNVGGVVGYANGDVSNCYATGSVSGNDGVGGVVGLANTVSNCYATGSVSGNDDVGGVVGLANTVSNCYATGSVSGNDGVGGVIGAAHSTVSYCVALNPSVSGSSDVGAIVGAGTTPNCYYWGGMSGTNLQIPTSGELTELDGVLMYGSTAFAWTANGFTTDNVWIIPTTPMQLPYLTGTSNRPAVSLASTDVYKTVILTHPTGKGELQYSTNSTNGTDGTWEPYTADKGIPARTGGSFKVYIKKAGYEIQIQVGEFPGEKGTEVQSWSGTINANTTLTPILTPIQYTITYDLADGTLDNGKTNPTTYDTEDNITLHNPTRTGYAFVGWTLDDSAVANTNVTIPTGSTGNKSYTARGRK